MAFLARSSMKLLAVYVAVAAGQELPIVMTSNGPVRGNTTGNVTAFYRVPYAAPPVKDLRFKPPKPVSDWSTTLDASAIPGPNEACIQNVPGPVGKEDCLKLDIYSPNLTGRAPVMLFVHGGGWGMGDSRMEVGRGGRVPLYDGHNMARNQDVVVVSVNYRLGALGLLALDVLAREPGSGNSTGNYALLDQRQAMVWVRDNIASFGGDPSKVLLFGESAGGTAVLAHLAMPASVGLFQAAIAESPFALRGLHTVEESQKGFMQTEPAQKCCKSASPCAPNTEFLECLRGLPADNFGYPGLGGWSPSPTIDHSEVGLKNTIFGMIQEGHGSKVPFIIGSNRYDSMVGCSTFPDVLKAFELQSGVSSQVPEASPEFGRAALNEALQNSGYSRNITDSQWNAIQAEYPLSDFPSASVRLATLFTQAAFSTSEGAHAAMIGHCASELFAKEYAKVSGKDVFLYSVDAIEGNDVVQHGDELPFVFHHVDDKFAVDPLLLNMPAAAREDMANMFGTYWGAFARKQNPNAPGLPRWSRFSGTAPFNEVLEIKTTVEMTVPSYQGKCDFWQSKFGDQTSMRSGGVAGPNKLRR